MNSLRVVGAPITWTVFIETLFGHHVYFGRRLVTHVARISNGQLNFRRTLQQPLCCPRAIRKGLHSSPTFTAEFVYKRIKEGYLIYPISLAIY